MKVEAGLTIKLPSVQFGNIDVYFHATLDTASDQARITESAGRMGLRGEGMTAELVSDVAMALAIEKLLKMKTDVDKKLAADTYVLQHFPPKK